MRLVEEYGDRKEKQGVKTGIQIGERNIIRNMYENGASIQMIAEMTGKSIPIVNKMLKA